MHLLGPWQKHNKRRWGKADRGCLTDEITPPNVMLLLSHTSKFEIIETSTAKQDMDGRPGGY
jgi:hypothetical protein